MQHTPGKFSCNTANFCWHSFSFCILSERVRGYSTDSILIALTYEAMALFLFFIYGNWTVCHKTAHDGDFFSGLGTGRYAFAYSR